MSFLLSVLVFLALLVTRYGWVLFFAEMAVVLLGFFTVWKFKPSALATGDEGDATPDSTENNWQDQTLEKKRKDLDKWRR